jgi:FKBP-type peptidyl-prolyl cis-trans isomerase
MDKKKFFLITVFIGIFLITFISLLSSGNKKNINEEYRKEELIMNELTIEDLVVGTGEEAVSGKMITVNYKGTLTNGTQFDSSYDRGQPFSFNLGAGEVIQGWDQGFSGMKVGGKRKLTIPPSLGYGSRDLGTIPSNSTLIFEVELLKVE